MNKFDHKDCSYLEKVAEFHKTFGHPILDKPQIPDAKRAKLRHELIREELEEFNQAIVQGDIVAAADALCDMQYVLSGAVLEFGLKDKFNELFAEVQRSNMSKACKNDIEALATQQFYKERDGIETYVKEKDGLFFVYRTSDNKALKSVNYSKADLKSIIERNGD